MGTWVKVQGHIVVDTSMIFDRFDLSVYRKSDCEHLQHIVTQWIKNSAKKHLENGLALDVGCDVTYGNGYGFDYVEGSHGMVEVDCYNYWTIYIDAWDRGGLHNNGQNFIEEVFHHLKSNGGLIDLNTLIYEKCAIDNTYTMYNGTTKVEVDMTALETP